MRVALLVVVVSIHQYVWNKQKNIIQSVARCDLLPVDRGGRWLAEWLWRTHHGQTVILQANGVEWSRSALWLLHSAWMEAHRIDVTKLFSITPTNIIISI